MASIKRKGQEMAGANRRASRWVASPTPSFSGPARSTASPGPANGLQHGSYKPVVEPSSIKHMHDRLTFLIVALVGTKVVATVKGGTKIEGILASATTEGELGICLKLAQQVHDAPVSRTMLIFGRDLQEIVASDIDLEERQSEHFKTDADIGGAKERKEKELQKWTGSQTTHLDASSLEEGGQTKWDQFATNAKLFGASTDYNEELYTTKLDRTASDFKLREQKAERLAQEILGSSSANTHIAEERGQVQEGDEEARYGAVIRGPNAYVPPAARNKEKDSKENKDKVNGSEKVERPPPRLPTITASVAPEDQSPPKKSETPEVVGSFKQFVSSERERLQQKKQALVKKEKDTRLADLRDFSQTFKLKTPVPPDLLPILGKKSEKVAQEAEAKKAEGVKSQTQTSTSSRPKPAFTAASIPQIPPFNPNRLRKPEGKPEPPKPESSKPVLSIPAFKPNPKATAFTPVSGSSPPQNKAVPVENGGPNPFFGDRLVKKGSSSIYVKEDFTPFKGGIAVEASSVATTWPFGNKSYRQLFPLAPNDEEQTPPPVPPQPSVAVPPNYPYQPYAPPPFRYQQQPPPQHQHPQPQHMHHHPMPGQPPVAYPQHFVQMPFQPPPPGTHSQPHPGAPVYSPQMAAMPPPPTIIQPMYPPPGARHVPQHYAYPPPTVPTFAPLPPGPPQG